MKAPQLTLERRPAALRKRYDNYIGGQWTKPVKGRYFSAISPLDQTPLADVARSGRRADHSLEFPAVDGSLENGAAAGCGQLHRD